MWPFKRDLTLSELKIKVNELCGTYNVKGSILFDIRTAYGYPIHLIFISSTQRIIRKDSNESNVKWLTYVEEYFKSDYRKDYYKRQAMLLTI